MPLISELETRVTALSARLLDTQIQQEAEAIFDPDLDGIAAFRLLVHAEIEDWIERCASESISELTKQLAISATLRTSSRLITLSSLFAVELPFSLPFDEVKLRSQLSETLNRARQFVKDNNGIKASSFCKVAMICGACIDEIDDALVQALNSYGTGRGMVAHKSSQRVTTLLAPSAEKNEAVNLIQLLKVFFGTIVPL